MERRKDDAAAARLRARRRRQQALAGVLLVAFATVASYALATSQRHAREDIEQRWSARTELTAGFVTTYVDELFEREADVARADLASGTTDFETVVRAFGFSNAVLLDDRGALLEVHPAKPGLVGKVIAPSYPHLTTAESGVRAVSPVVPGAADGQPVVGFALPFDTPQGRRVFSGAYPVRDTPLAAYLERTTTLPGAGIYLVDASGTVVTASFATPRVVGLSDLDPALAAAAHGRASGEYADQFFAKHAVTGTPWTVLARTPTKSLFRSIDGPGRYVPWGLLGVIVSVVAVTLSLAFRRSEDHAQLRQAYARLDRLASLDGLTELPNRRSVRERLDAAHDRVRHEGGWLSVLMVDVDHFKRINDTFGHAGGDVALVAVADRLRHALREDDVVGRWGGEEFLVVLPMADPERAAEVAERLRAAVSGSTVAVGHGGDDIAISISVGVASATDALPDVLVHAADRALYAAKAQGRDQVFALQP